MKQRRTHVKIWDVVKFCCYCIYFSIFLPRFFAMVEVDEDPQLGLESEEEDDDELSDSEVRANF